MRRTGAYQRATAGGGLATAGQPGAPGKAVALWALSVYLRNPSGGLSLPAVRTLAGGVRAHVVAACGQRKRADHLLALFDRRTHGAGSPADSLLLQKDGRLSGERAQAVWAEGIVRQRLYHPSKQPARPAGSGDFELYRHRGLALPPFLRILSGHGGRATAAG